MPPTTCASASSSTTNSTENGGGVEEIMLFGVRVVVDSMRKSVSMNNLSQYEQPHESNNNNKNNNNNKGDDNVAAGYASADDAVPHSNRNRERKRGVPWTEEEHKLFLLGLQKVGKGDWRGISRNFVKTRTPTQVASHAQKYFLRQNNLNRRRRRSSLFDITTDTVAAIPMEEEQVDQLENAIQPPETNRFPMTPAAFPMTVNPVVLSFPVENPAAKLICPVPTFLAPQTSDLNLNLNSVMDPSPLSLKLDLNSVMDPSPLSLKLDLNSVMDPSPLSLKLDLNSVMDPSPLSLKLSLQSDQMDSSTTSSRHSAFQVMPSLSNGDSNSIISVV